MSQEYLDPGEGFLGSDAHPPSPGPTTRVCVIPCSLEASVTWGSGTALGPSAILAASRAVELFDIREGREPDTPGSQGRDVVRILQAGQTSIANDGAPISLIG